MPYPTGYRLSQPDEDYSSAPMLPSQRIVRRSPYAPLMSAGGYDTPSYPRMSMSGGGYGQRASAPVMSESAPISAPSFPYNRRAPMIGGSEPQDMAVTGQRNIEMSDQMMSRPVTPPNHLNVTNTGANKISEQALHAMWHASLSAYGDSNGALADFEEKAARYGANGRALVDHWKNTGAPNMQTTYTDVPGTNIPVSMVGTDKSGGTPPPGLISMERGMMLKSPSMHVPSGTAPLSGYSNIGSDMVLPSTATLTRAISAPNRGMTTMQSPENTYPDNSQEQARSMIPMARIRDEAQKPYTQADAQRSRNMEAGNLRAVGEAKIAQSPVTGREAFQAGTEIAQAAANAPVAAATINAQGRVDAAKAKGPAAGGVSGQARPMDYNAALGHFVKTLVPKDLSKPMEGDNMRFVTAQEAQTLARAWVQGNVAPQAGGGAPTTQPSTYGANGAEPIDGANAGGHSKGITGKDGKTYYQHSDGLYYPEPEDRGV